MALFSNRKGAQTHPVMNTLTAPDIRGISRRGRPINRYVSASTHSAKALFAGVPHKPLMSEQKLTVRTSERISRPLSHDCRQLPTEPDSATFRSVASNATNESVLVRRTEPSPSAPACQDQFSVRQDRVRIGINLCRQPTKLGNPLNTTKIAAKNR